MAAQIKRHVDHFFADTARPLGVALGERAEDPRAAEAAFGSAFSGGRRRALIRTRPDGVVDEVRLFFESMHDPDLAAFWKAARAALDTRLGKSERFHGDPAWYVDGVVRNRILLMRASCEIDVIWMFAD